MDNSGLVNTDVIGKMITFSGTSFQRTIQAFSAATVFLIMLLVKDNLRLFLLFSYWFSQSPCEFLSQSVEMILIKNSLKTDSVLTSCISDLCRELITNLTLPWSQFDPVDRNDLANRLKARPTSNIIVLDHDQSYVMKTMTQSRQDLVKNLWMIAIPWQSCDLTLHEFNDQFFNSAELTPWLQIDSQVYFMSKNCVVETYRTSEERYGKTISHFIPLSSNRISHIWERRQVSFIRLDLGLGVRVMSIGNRCSDLQIISCKVSFYRFGLLGE